MFILKICSQGNDVTTMTKHLTILIFIGLAFWGCENNGSVNNQLCCDELSFDGTWRRDSFFSYFNDDSGMIETTQKVFEEFQMIL